METETKTEVKVRFEELGCQCRDVLEVRKGGLFGGYYLLFIDTVESFSKLSPYTLLSDSPITNNSRGELGTHLVRYGRYTVQKI